VKSLSPIVVALATAIVIVPLAPSSAWATTDADLCLAAKESAAAAYANCRLMAQSRFAKTSDSDRLSATLAKCSAKLFKGFQVAEERYGTSCSAIGDVTTTQTFLGGASDRLVAFLASGSPGPGERYCDLGTTNDPVTLRCAADWLVLDAPSAPSGYVFRADRGSWSERTPAPRGRYEAGVAVVDGKIFTIATTVSRTRAASRTRRMLARYGEVSDSPGRALRGEARA